MKLRSAHIEIILADDPISSMIAGSTPTHLSGVILQKSRPGLPQHAALGPSSRELSRRVTRGRLSSPGKRGPVKSRFFFIVEEYSLVSHVFFFGSCRYIFFLGLRQPEYKYIRRTDTVSLHPPLPPHPGIKHPRSAQTAPGRAAPAARVRRPCRAA